VTTFSLILAIGYFLIMLITAWALAHLSFAVTEALPKVSIVVAARNEECVLPALLQSLEALQYPADRYQVVLVDDDSEDGTHALLDQFARQHSNWKVLRHSKADDRLKGKKGPLTLAIMESEGDIILATDADCVVPPGWIKSMVRYFTPQTGMVLGHSPVVQEANFLNKLLRFDSLCEASAAAATTHFNKPLHSNGRNLAFRRTAFDEVNGYAKISKIATGDDFFLSQLISRKTHWKIAYNTDPESYVVTHSERWNRKFVHQQLRRNGKAFYLRPVYFCLAAWVFLFHLTLLVLLFLPGYRMLFAILLAGKFAVELLATRQGAQRFRQEKLLRYFPVMWLLYPVFIIGFAVLGSLQLYRWK